MYQCIFRPSGTKRSKFFSFIPFFSHFFFFFFVCFSGLFRLLSALLVIIFYSPSLTCRSFSLPSTVSHIDTFSMETREREKPDESTIIVFYEAKCIVRTMNMILHTLLYNAIGILGVFVGACICSRCEFNVICGWNGGRGVREKERMIYVIQFE